MTIPLSSYYSISHAAAPHIDGVLRSADAESIVSCDHDGMYDTEVSQCARRYASALGVGADTIEVTDLAPGRAPLFRVSRGVAVVPVRGVLTKDRSVVQSVFGGFSTGEVTDAIHAATDDRDITTLVLDGESPGGSVHGLDDAADALAAFRASREDRTVLSAGGMIASAAYFIASQADRVFAARGDFVGSIGSALVIYDFSGMLSASGIRAIAVDSSPPDRPFKTAGAFGTEITDVQVAEFQRIVDAYFASFRAAVERGRGRRLRGERLDAVADGRVFVAGDASREADPVRLGLIDGVRNMRSVLRDAVAADIATNDRRQKVLAISQRID